MKQPLRILHLEDSVEDSELIRHLLLRGKITCDMRRVETRAEFFDALQKGAIDLILADLKLPDFSGMHALEIARALQPDIPFVFISGTMGEETAINSLRNGATDYVLKGQLGRLVPAVNRALAEAEERTLRRQLQERLREVARLEAVGTLSSGIAHDFNNVLTIILGHASLLTKEADRPQRVREIAATITDAAKRASDVVQQLLAFAHQGNPHAVPIDLNHRIESALAVLRETVPDSIEMRFEPAPGVPDLLVDVEQLEQVLHNLVANAVDSMPNGGRIVISTERVSGQNIPGFIPELATETYVRVRVADTGPGIDPTTRDHIFEPFFTTKERGRGTGLGLPVVYGVMQAHNGWIHIESEPGRGTAVLLFFPVPRQSLERPPVGAPPADQAAGGGETLLVVEDEEDVRVFLETVLEGHGYRILLARDREEARPLFRAHEESIQLVFSDVGLPGTDGIALCTELRARKPSLKVVLSSGYSPKEFRERLESLAPDAFLPKPYTTHGILHAVRDALDGAAALASP